MRGKYAVRARSKRDADRRLSIARKEADALRTKAAEIRDLRAEREVLLSQVAELRNELRKKESTSVQELRELLREAEAKWKRDMVDASQQVRRVIEASLDIMERTKKCLPPGEWWPALVPALRWFIRSSEWHVKLDDLSDAQVVALFRQRTA